MNILPPAQTAMWSKLRPFKRSGFVLYGGTAIALQIGHRESVDFDFFSSQNLNKKKLTQACPWLDTAMTLQDEPNTWTLISERSETGVKFSFFGGLGIGRVGAPKTTTDQVLLVADLRDLFALKLSVILKRAEAKDYIDLAALINKGLSLELGLAGARALYGDTFQPCETLKAMTYFEDGDLASLKDETKTTLVDASKQVGRLPKIERRSNQLT